MTNACWQVAPGFTITKTMALDPESPYSLGFQADRRQLGSARLGSAAFYFSSQPAERIVAGHSRSITSPPAPPNERKIKKKSNAINAQKCTRRENSGCF